MTNEELNNYIDECHTSECEKRFFINPGYMMREIAGEYVIIPTDEECLIKNAMMTPNETAVSIWEGFKDPNTIENVCKKLLSEYDASEEQVKKAVDSFVIDALSYGILKEENA